MSYVNGQLPDSALAAIPGGRLRKDAALRWNAMCVYSRAHGTGTPMPNGSLSTYRNLAGQILLRREWCSRGACGNAAVPGTSNHGLGIAVDTNQGYVCDRYTQYGWSKTHSDAPWESWHRKWDGSGPTGPARHPVTGFAPTCREGDYGPAVHRLQSYLMHKGFFHHSRDGHFGAQTRASVIKFQRSRRLKADGVVGPATWRALRTPTH